MLLCGTLLRCSNVTLVVSSDNGAGDLNGWPGFLAAQRCPVLVHGAVEITVLEELILRDRRVARFLSQRVRIAAKILHEQR